MQNPWFDYFVFSNNSDIAKIDSNRIRWFLFPRKKAIVILLIKLQSAIPFNFVILHQAEGTPYS